MGEFTSINGSDGSGAFNAYVATPSEPPKAAIIVIQEIFGVNKGIRAKCDKWAENGYLALSPDLFWRMKPGLEFNSDIPTEFHQAIDYMNKFDRHIGVDDIAATIKHARRQSGVNKVGAVGFCLGGALSYMTAARTDIDAAACYYAVGVVDMLGEGPDISCPVAFHIPTEDGFVPTHQQKAMHDALDSNDLMTLYDYEGQDHGFAAEFGKRRDEDAANLADRRTMDFFDRYLRD